MYARVKETSRLRPLRRLGLIGLSGLIVLGALASCSSEQPEEPQEPPVTETAIAFTADEQQDQMVTRSTGLEEQNVKTFTVWGYKNNEYANGVYGGLQAVFPGYTVNWLDNSAASTTTNSHGWEYVNQQASGAEQTIKYWDWNASAYRFFGVATTTNGANVTNEANEANGPYEFSFEADATNEEKAPFYSRLWFSTGDPATYPNQQFGKPVQLEFLKPFAKVRFMFRYSYVQEGVNVEDPVFKPSADFDTSTPAGIPLKGTFKVIYPLTGTATSEDFEATPDADNRPVEAPAVANRLEAFTEEYIPEGTEKWYTVLPVKSQGSYTLSVKVNKTEKKCTVPAEYMTWLPGYSYTYIFKITDDGGVEIDLVQSAVTTWTEQGTTHSVYNW